MPEAKQSIRLDPREIDFVCTDAEIKAAVRLIDRTNKGRELITSICVMLLLGVYCYRQSPGDRVVFLSIFGGISLIYFAWKYWPNRPGSQPGNCRLSDTGIRMTTSTAVCQMPYSTFATCLESSDMFVLLDQRKTTPIPVPKRIFPNEEWLNWFRAMTGKLERPRTTDAHA